MSGIREDAAEAPGGVGQEAEDEYQHREEIDQRGLAGKKQLSINVQNKRQIALFVGREYKKCLCPRAMRLSGKRLRQR